MKFLLHKVIRLMPPPHPVLQNSFYSAIFKSLIQNFSICKEKKINKAVGLTLYLLEVPTFCLWGSSRRPSGYACL